MKIIATLTALLLLALPGWAFDVDFTSLSGDFRQTVSSSNSSLEYAGSFIITQHSALWQYTSPAKKQIYVNDAQVVIIEDDLEQVSFATLDRVPQLGQIFKAAKKQGEELVAEYEGVKYTVGLAGGELVSLSYTDEFDNAVRIVFSGLKRNAPVPPGTFEPRYPATYDLVK